MKSSYLVLSAAALVLAQSTWAQEGKVIKASKNRALVQFPSDVNLRPGDSVSVGSGGSGGGGGGGAAAPGPRDHSIDFSASVLSGSSSGQSHSVLGASAQYGWNKITMEYGPLAAFSSSSPGSNSNFAVGGFFDYNLIPNKRGVKFVYGAGATAQVGQASSGGSSGQVMTIFGGGFIKYFPLGNTVAVRADAGAAYNKSSAGGTSTSETDLTAKAGLEVYFGEFN